MWRASFGSSSAEIKTLVLLCFACTAGCRRRQSSAASEVIRSPSSSSSTVTSPLANPSTGFTNAEQAEFLRKESDRLGIKRLGKPSQPGEPEDTDMQAPLSYQEGLARTRALSAQFQAEREAMNHGKSSVDLGGEQIPALIPSEARGGPIESTADAKTQP